MASSTSRTLSFRVPIGVYENLINEAIEKKLNMTELLSSKVINSEVPTVEKVETDSPSLKDKVIALEKALEESKLLHRL